MKIPITPARTLDDNMYDMEGSEYVCMYALCFTHGLFVLYYKMLATRSFSLKKSWVFVSCTRYLITYMS